MNGPGDAALEAGVKALHADGCCLCRPGECRYPADIPDVELESARIVLDAATPHIRAQVAGEKAAKPSSRWRGAIRRLFWEEPAPELYDAAALDAAAQALHADGCSCCQQGVCRNLPDAAEAAVAELVLTAAAPHIRAGIIPAGQA